MSAYLVIHHLILKKLGSNDEMSKGVEVLKKRHLEYIDYFRMRKFARLKWIEWS